MDQRQSCLSSRKLSTWSSPSSHYFFIWRFVSLRHTLSRRGYTADGSSYVGKAPCPSHAALFGPDSNYYPPSTSVSKLLSRSLAACDIRLSHFGPTATESTHPHKSELQVCALVCLFVGSGPENASVCDVSLRILNVTYSSNSHFISNMHCNSNTVFRRSKTCL